MVSDLYQLSRQLAQGTSSQKCRVWRQFFEEGVFWRRCRDTTRAPDSIDHLAAIHQSWTSRWDREPIGEMVEAADEEVDLCVRAAASTLACAAVAALARGGKPDWRVLQPWLRRAVGASDGTRARGEVPPSTERGEALIRSWFRWLSQDFPDRNALAHAQDTTLALFREPTTEEPQPGVGRLRIPVLLSRGNDGYVAWLWLERVAQGFGEFLQSPDTRFDPLSPELRAALDAAFRISARTVRLAPDEDLRWWLANVPGKRTGAAAPVVGASLQAAALAGTITLLQNLEYDGTCAVSATIDADGLLGGVAGIEGYAPKLRAAVRLRTEHDFATVVVAPASFPSESTRKEWEARRLRIRSATTIHDALAIVQRRPTAVSIGRPKPSDAGGGAPSRSRTAAILYARESEPQRAQALELAEQLRGLGLDVFVDQGVGAGVGWAREADQRIRGADLVVPLVSAAAGESEVFSHQLQSAADAAAARSGQPRIIPVALEATDILPDQLAGRLPLGETLSWDAPQEAGSLAASILAAFAERPRPVRESVPTPAGVLPLDSRFYIDRPTDREFTDAIARCDSIVRVKGARQMGKTSLLARGLQQARQAGAVVVLTDCQMFNTVHLQDVETFLSTVARWFIRQLKLNFRLEDVWDQRQGPNWNFREFLLYEVLARMDQPLVWALDEVDRLFTCPFGGEVFALFRSWHNERALDPTAPLTQLTLAMAYATETHLFISEPNQSPFNVGTRVTLEDFSRAETADLNDRYRRPLRTGAEIDAYWRLLGGQPYLTHRGLHAMAERGTSLAAFEREALSDNGLFGDHLHRLVLLLGENAELCEAVRRVVRGDAAPSADSFFRLWSAGILAGDSARNARPRCELYATYLERHLP